MVLDVDEIAASKWTSYHQNFSQTFDANPVLSPLARSTRFHCVDVEHVEGLLR